jgi:hypothetical protein
MHKKSGTEQADVPRQLNASKHMDFKAGSETGAEDQLRIDIG